MATSILPSLSLPFFLLSVRQVADLHILARGTTAKKHVFLFIFAYMVGGPSMFLRALSWNFLNSLWGLGTE
jgi:hypothetical protein